MSSVPVWAWIVTLAGVVGMLAAAVRTLPRPARPPAVAILGLWLALTATLAADGVFSETGRDAGVVPWIGPMLLVGLLLGVAGLRSVRVDPTALTGVQVFRVVGGLFLALMLVGLLPPAFALPAGLGDVAVGLAAPVIARRLRRGDTRGARVFHVLGIVDLVVAVSLGLLSAPGTLGLLADGAVTTAPLALLPLVLVPTTLVPLSVAMHLHVLRDIAGAPSRAGSRPARRAEPA
jgi:hypothetical protein